MKICFISPGTFEHVQSYIDFFKENGHEVYFLALSPTPDRNVKTINCFLGRNELKDKRPKKWQYVMSAIIAKFLISKIKPDIVHAHFATSSGLAAWIIGHRNTIISAHGTDVNAGVESTFWRYFLKQFFKSAKIVHVVSQQLENKVANLGISKNKICNLNVGIPVEKFRISRTNNDNDELKLLCNRSFETVYDHQTILDSLLCLRDKNVNLKLTLIGDGSLKGRLIRFVKDNNLESNVTFIGRIPYEEQIKYFKNNHIYISSSLSDGTSLSLLEALSAGLYPVVSDISANTEWIEDGVNGALFPIKEPNYLASLLEKLFNDRKNIFKVSSINQNLVDKKGSRSKNMIELENIYKRVLDGK